MLDKSTKVLSTGLCTAIKKGGKNEKKERKRRWSKKEKIRKLKAKYTDRRKE